MVVLAGAPARRNHHAAVDKIAGDLNRSIQEAAGVIAQVEDQAVQPAVRAIFEAADGAGEFRRCGFGEGGDASKSGACWLGAEILHGDVILTD